MRVGLYFFSSWNSSFLPARCANHVANSRHYFKLKLVSAKVQAQWKPLRAETIKTSTFPLSFVCCFFFILFDGITKWEWHSRNESFVSFAVFYWLLTVNCVSSSSIFFSFFFLSVGEIMRRLLSCVCGRVCRDHSDDDGRAHEPVADTARVRLQRPRPILHLLHRLITQRPNSRLRLQSSHRLYARSRWDSKTANCNKTFSFHPQCQE